MIKSNLDAFALGTRWATDNITISCLVWDKRATTQRIIVRPKSQIVGFYKNPEQAISQERAEEIVRALAKLNVRVASRREVIARGEL